MAVNQNIFIMEGYEEMRGEIKRLHLVCRTKDVLLRDCVDCLRAYKQIFDGKTSVQFEDRAINIIGTIESHLS